MADQQASASFFGIGQEITVRVPVAALSRRDQQQLLHALMQQTGFTAALYGDSTEAQRSHIDNAWKEAFKDIR